MRASSFASLVVVMSLALANGCSPADDPPAVAVPPEPPAPLEPLELGPAPGPSQATVDELLREVENARSAAQSQAAIDGIRERTGGPRAAPTENSAAPSDYVPSRTLDRLIFQCADDVTFAIRMAGDRLEVYPPGHTVGHVVLGRVPSDTGVHYTARNTDFRMNGDLATLQIGRDRYVDCVSNPAAAVWQEAPRRDTPPR